MFCNYDSAVEDLFNCTPSCPKRATRCLDDGQAYGPAVLALSEGSLIW